MSPPRPPDITPTPAPSARNPPFSRVPHLTSSANDAASGATPTPAPLRLATVGEQFDKYTLLAKLATGGMAELFVAELSGAAGFSKKVVVKRILPHVAHDEHFTRMFLDEAMTCAQINHPNVCQVFELCESAGSHFLVLEHLEGATVGDLIRRCLASEQQLNLRLAVGIIVQACDGLHAAHEQTDDEGRNSNLVHRDVSPGNLFVTVDGIVKVLDFGIAKARWMSRKTKTGTLLGKCEYMSPEQARGGVPLDRRADIFSLGIIAWELLCGRRLFRRESEYETLRAVLRAPIESPRSLRPGIPEALEHAVMRALERDPADRFRTAYEFRQAMSDALRDVGGPTPMCDIAPLIRKSFAEELRIQRAVLKQASEAAEMSNGGMKRLASAASPVEEDDEFANTDVRTAEHQRLPSLAGAVDDHDSGELTFRVLPAGPPSQVTAESGSAIPPRFGAPEGQGAAARPRRISSPPPLSAPPLPEEPEPTAAKPVPAAVFTPDLTQSLPPALTAVPRLMVAPTDSGPVQNPKTTRVLLALTLLLGAAVTTGSLMFFSNRGSEVNSAKNAPVAPASSTPSPVAAAPSSVPTKAAVALPADAGNRPATGSPVPVAASSALENAAVQAEILAANREAPAVVTALPAKGSRSGDDPEGAMGTLRIESSEPGDVYLYPSKEIIGRTPLEYELEPGRYKLKVQIGPERSQKKYFYVKIEADGSINRHFDHW